MTIKITSKPFLICATATALACGIAGYAWREEHRPPLLEIYVFNLKSGSSVFVRTPDDKRILINGGANSEVIRELTKILPFYSRRIDTIIATDTGGKNVSGLIDVLDRYAVDKIVVPAITLQTLNLASSTDQIYATFIDTVRRLKVPLQEVSADDVLDFGQKIGDQKISAGILFPVASTKVVSANIHSDVTSFVYSKASAPEIIMRISYGQTSIILLGNATTKVQKFLISSTKSVGDNDLSTGDNIHSNDGVRTDVLVVPHSALASSLSVELMNEMRPKILVYSQAITSSSKKPSASKSVSSKNKKIDPLYFILDDKRFNIKETGTVKIVSDGVRILVK